MNLFSRRPLFKKSYLSAVNISRQYNVTASSEETVNSFLQSHDELQQTYLKEVCILVNENDKFLGSASKKDCHLLSNINGGMLHRAFSVFLFNSKNELLLQQRSNAKITFPGMFTNTCCSHPLSTKLEMDEEKAMGVKRAAQRKLFHELGITPDQIPLNIFEYITRIQYSALNQPNDGIFGENEIDYVLIVKRDVDVSLNYNEVQSYRYVDQEGMKDLLAKAESGHILLTPWFTMICKEFLFKWWANLKKTTDFVDHKSIHKLSQ